MTTLAKPCSMQEAIEVAYEEVGKDFKNLFYLHSLPVLRTDIQLADPKKVSWIEHDAKLHYTEIFIDPKAMAVNLIALGFYESPLPQFLKLVKDYSKMIILFHFLELTDIRFGSARFTMKEVTEADLSTERQIIHNNHAVRYAQRLVTVSERIYPNDYYMNLLGELYYRMEYQVRYPSSHDFDKYTQEIKRAVNILNDILKENEANEKLY